MRHTGPVLASFLAALALGACQTAQPVTHAAVTTRPVPTHALRMAVARIDVIPPRQTTSGPLTNALIAATRDWAMNRLSAVGGDGAVTVTIREAAFTETALPKTSGLKGMFTNDQVARRDVRLAVEIAGNKPSANGFQGRTTVNVNRFATVAENTTINERDVQAKALIDQLIADLDPRAETGIRRDLSPLLVR